MQQYVSFATWVPWGIVVVALLYGLYQFFTWTPSKGREETRRLHERHRDWRGVRKI